MNRLVLLGALLAIALGTFAVMHGENFGNDYSYDGDSYGYDGGDAYTYNTGGDIRK